MYVFMYITVSIIDLALTISVRSMVSFDNFVNIFGLHVRSAFDINNAIFI